MHNHDSVCMGVCKSLLTKQSKAHSSLHRLTNYVFFMISKILQQANTMPELWPRVVHIREAHLVDLEGSSAVVAALHHGHADGLLDVQVKPDMRSQLYMGRLLCSTSPMCGQR